MENIIFMEIDFVTYKIAEKLKAKGFPQVKKNTLAMYNETGEWFSLARNLDVYEYSFIDFDDRDCVCPTIEQALKWLREKSIHINIEIFNSGWFCSVRRFSKEKDDLYKINPYLFTGNYNDYEEAALNAIEYILDNNLI